MDELVLFLVFFAIVGLVTALLRVFKPKRIVILQYQRGVLFNKGVVEKVLEPGPYWITISKSITLIDIRLQTLNVAGQEILTADGLSLKISLAGEYQIDNPERFLLSSVSATSALYTSRSKTLRDAVAELSFDTILATRSASNMSLWAVSAVLHQGWIHRLRFPAGKWEPADRRRSFMFLPCW